MTERAASRHSSNPWVVLVLFCIAQFMVILDATIVTSRSSIQVDLKMSNSNLQWVGTAG